MPRRALLAALLTLAATAHADVPPGPPAQRVPDAGTLTAPPSPAPPEPPRPAPPEAVDECVAHDGKVCVLASGVSYLELRAGKGAQPRAGAQVTVHYTGRFASSGKVFDSSRGHKPWSWTWGKSGAVIAGYELGLASARVGARRQLVIPPEQAYGKQGFKKIIPPDATLLFDLELLSVK